MNFTEMIIIVALAACAAAAVIVVVVRRRRGKNCPCGCEGCPYPCDKKK